MTSAAPAPTTAPTRWPAEVSEVFQRFRVAEMSTVAKDGTPITVPLCVQPLPDGRFRLTTSIGLPAKAFNIRRNPKVSLLFSDPTASKLESPAVVLVQGEAEAPDEIVTQLEGREDYWVHRIFRRQPDGAVMAAWPLRPWTDWYFMRLFITVTPRRVRWWPKGDLSSPPREVEGLS